MSTVYKVSLVLIIIGAVNWGMVGIFNINLVELLFGVDAFLTNLIYALVGICGLLSTGILLKPLDSNEKTL